MRRAIITLLVLLSFGLKAQVYQAMPQAGYGPVKRMLFDSVLTIPLNINQLRNITGGRDAGQIRYNVTDSGLYVYSGYQWIKANLDSTNISNRINGKLNISDTAAMLLPYMKFIDTVSLSNRINLRVKYSDTAQMLLPYLRKLDTASLSRRIDKKQDSIILTTNFKSGAATLNGANLNIPKYSDTLSDAYVPYVGANKNVDLGAYNLTGTFLNATGAVQIQDNGTGYSDLIGYTSLYTNNDVFTFRTSRLLPNNLTKTRQAAFLYPVEGDGYLTTFNYNLPVRNGTLALVEDTVNLSNRINLKADKATTLTINGVTYNLSANRSWTIPVFDSTSISNRIDLKLNISDTASMLSPYLRKTDTSSLSNRIDLKLNISDTASMLSGYQTAINSKLNPSDTVSLSNRINTKQGIITLTTNNNSGVATFISNVLNIPNYTTDVSGFVPYTGANQNVNLGVYDLTADVVNGTKGSFTSNGSANTFDISHTSGSGIGLNITKGGNGEGLYINKTSGSGNAATIIGTLNATTLVKSGGTSSQFLKADGSVDSNIYISDTTSLSNRINLKLNATDTASLSNRINAKADALSGTTNTVPKFTSSTTIGNSNIKDDGNVVSVSTTAGSNGALQVGNYNGNILMNTTNTNAGLIFKNTSSSNKLWDISSFNNDLNFNESNISPTVMTLKAGGDVIVSNLSGSGTRMVVASSTGVLSTQAITGVDTTSLSNRINLKLNISDTASMLSGYQSAINSKQAQINGTGFVKASGTTISYDNSTYYLASNPNGYTTNTGTVTSVATGLGLSGGTITTSGTLLVDTASASILSRQRAANTYYLASNPNGYTSNTGTVTSVAALTLGTSGTDLSSTVANGTTTPVITLNVPTASASNRGALSSADWTTFNNKQNALTNPTTGTGTANYHAKFTGSTTLGNSLIYDNGTSVGIGTASPISLLNLYGSNQLQIQNATTGNTGADGTRVQLDGSNFQIINRESADIILYTNDTERMRLASTGAATFSSSVTAGGNINLNTNNGILYWNNTGGGTNYGYIQGSSGLMNIQAASGGDINFGNGSDLVRIKASGNVGINTTTPAAKIEAVSTTSGAGGWFMAGQFTAAQYPMVRLAATTPNKYSSFGNDGDGSLSFFVNGNSGAVGTTALTLASTGAATFSGQVNASGNIILTGATSQIFGGTEDGRMFVNNSTQTTYIGLYGNTYTGTPNIISFVNNSASTLVLKANNTVLINNLAGTGSRAVFADASGILSAPVSDSSVKENIKPLNYGIADIMKLKPVNFEYIKSYKNFGEGKQIGNIAQDMAKVIPEAVFTTPSTGKMGINYDQLNGVYIKALQELQEQINTLKLEIQTLKNK